MTSTAYSSDDGIPSQEQAVSSTKQDDTMGKRYFTRESVKRKLVPTVVPIVNDCSVEDENYVSGSLFSDYEGSSDEYVPSDSESDSEKDDKISRYVPSDSESDIEKDDKISRKNSVLPSTSSSIKIPDESDVSSNSTSLVSFVANKKHSNVNNSTAGSSNSITVASTLENIGIIQADENIITYSQIKKTATGKRLRDKCHCCYVCNKLLLNNMARHFEHVHGEDVQIAKILALPKRSRQRREEFENLIRVGDFYYNCNILAIKQGELILVRRPDETKDFTYSDFGPCPHCLGFMSKKYLWHHIKFGCSVRRSKPNNLAMTGKGPMHESSALIFQCCGFQLSQNFSESVVSNLRSDTIGTICKEDDLILNFGHFLFEKHGTSQLELIRQAMRQLAKLKKQLIEVTEINKPLKNFLLPEHFDNIITATKLISGSSFDIVNKKQEFDTPSLALKIGHSIKKCISIERGQAIRKGDLKRNKELERLLSLVDMEWATKISSNALATMYKRKMNEQQLLPLTSDLKKLSMHLNEKMTKLVSVIQQCCNREIWKKLASVVLCKIILFNKRRSGEASRMTLENYSSRPCWKNQGTEELKNSLTPLELQLAESLTVVEIVGKRGRKVPVILTHDVKSALDVLLGKRLEGGIIPGNNFIFAKSQGSELYLRGHICLQKECNEACLQSAENITSTKLRKYTATVCQIFNLNENELDWLARHLGHDIRVHRDFYRLHESAVEVTKISRLLLALDKGQAYQFAGKKLDDINLNGKFIYTGGLKT